jgi:hypothetical protein
MYDFPFFFEKHNAKPDPHKKRGTPKVKLIVRRLVGISPALDWV